MAVKYHCTKCSRKFVDWGAEKVKTGGGCEDCEGEFLEAIGFDASKPAPKKKKKPALKRKTKADAKAKTKAKSKTTTKAKTKAKAKAKTKTKAKAKGKPTPDKAGD